MKKLLAAVFLAAVAIHAAPRPFPIKELGGSTRLQPLGNRVLAFTLEAPMGRNLSSINGTAASVVKLAADVQNLGPVCGPFLYFNQWIAPDGWQVWRTDGTAAGTRRVTLGELESGPTACVGDILVYSLLAGGHSNVVRTLGDPAATTVILGNLGGGQGMTPFRGEVWFTSAQGPNGSNVAIFKANAATGTVAKVIDGSAYNFTVAGDTLFFVGIGGLWRSDGTPAGTYLVFPFGNRPFDIQRTFAFHDLFFFVSNYELWRSDGTLTGTYKLVAVGEDLSFAVYRDALWFGAAQTLWKTDGTLAGTQPAVTLYGAGTAVDPLSLTVAGDRLYFADHVAGPIDYGDELWSTDGTTAELVADLEPGAGGSSPRQLAVAGPFLYFTAKTTAFGNELWALPVGPVQGIRRRAR